MLPVREQMSLYEEENISGKFNMDVRTVNANNTLLERQGGNHERRKRVKDYSSLVAEFVMYLKESKSYWLAPVIFVLLLLSSLAFFLEGSVLAPAIYSIF